MEVADCWYKYKSEADSPDQIRIDIRQIWREITQSPGANYKTNTSSYQSIVDP
ncbi:hypothetical protein LINGRAHAP2_LOCUS10874, partial [Linum grandiflorum]